MRPVQLADVEVVARVLLCIPSGRRLGAIARICANADIADRYRKRLDRCHPVFGTGTLMSAASRYAKAARPDGCSAAYLDCIRVTATFLQDRAWHHTA